MEYTINRLSNKLQIINSKFEKPKYYNFSYVFISMPIAIAENGYGNVQEIELLAETARKRPQREGGQNCNATRTNFVAVFVVRLMAGGLLEKPIAIHAHLFNRRPPQPNAYLTHRFILCHPVIIEPLTNTLLAHCTKPYQSRTE